VSRVVRPIAISEASLPAPATGILLGTDRTGAAFSLRLFRPVPTRIVVVSGPFLAQLVAMRASRLGVPVRVLSDQPSSWATVLQHGADARLVPDEDSPLLNISGPMVVIDERATRRNPRELADWQCRLELQAVQPDAYASHGPSLAGSDLAAFGLITPDLAAAAAAAFGLDRAGLDLLRSAASPQSMTLVTRGRVEQVRVIASPDEVHAVRAAAR
jgi:hypothetical protein